MHAIPIGRIRPCPLFRERVIHISKGKIVCLVCFMERPKPEPDPEMVKQCLAAYERGDYWTTEELLKDIRDRAAAEADDSA